MKNKEKYVDDIIAIASNGYNIAVRRVYEQVVGCEATDCRDCVFLEGNCAENRQKWLESEADPTIDELKAELETLKKERDELRARLEKAVELPCKVMIERTLVNGKFKPTQKAQAFNGRIGVVYRDETRWKGLLVDICSEKTFDYKAAEARLKELQGGER